ncbi:MAG: HAD-IB family phosphatase [Chloroflexi bacterium]|nr:HAD-IB family phosphatase [Chloroflexota bacterium]
MIVVQCEFDDTVTAVDLGYGLREAFAPDGWTAMEEDFLAGRCSPEENIARQFKLIKASKQDIEDFVLGNVVLRPEFGEFVDYCRGVGLRLVIVSSGLDIYINLILGLLELEDLEVHSGKATIGSNGIDVVYSDPDGERIESGLKEAYVKHYKEAGHTVVYVGQGLSDVAPAEAADFVIARSSLAEHLTEQGRPYDKFDTFQDVGKCLEEIRKQLGDTADGKQ